MKDKAKKRMAMIGAVLAVGLVAALVLVPILNSAQADTTDESGLSASLSFNTEPNPQSQSLMAADFLGQSTNPFSFLTVSSSQLGSFSVIDTTSTVDVTNSYLIVEAKGKILPANGMILFWSLQGTMDLKSDGKLFRSYALSAQGSGNPPNPAIIKMNAGNFDAIPVSTFRNSWGPSGLGNHTLSLSGSASLTVTFTDTSVAQKVFTSNDLGKVVLNVKSDATVVFELSSSFGSTGTTTTVTTIIDTWSGKMNTADYVNDFQPRLAMKILEPTRANMDLASFTVHLYKNTEVSAAGEVQGVLIKASDGMVIARSENIISRNTFTQSYEPTTFTFPDDTITPSGGFYVGIECLNCDTYRILMGLNRDNPYAGGHIEAGRAVGWLPYDVRDAFGSVSYRITTIS